ncbi:MAG: hypothetical protein ACR652_15045 [Methylocystis sp.]|uniref:hypothetical protein n=1 Tax=Methylocystis sp. TaxID=1911079 RepID=UPI003DA5F907
MLEYLQSAEQRAIDEIRQLHQLAKVIADRLESTLLEQLPDEIVRLLGILEVRQIEIENSRFCDRTDEHDR